VAFRDIKKGARIENKDLIIKRPGYGIHPKMINIVVGRIARKDFIVDDPITWQGI
jgi:sialic acid synthase SpsE